MKTILYSDDITLIEYWESALKSECEVALSLEELLAKASTLVVLNLSACETRAQEVLQKLYANGNKIFVMQPNPTLQELRALMSVPISGYANAYMDKELFASAIESVKVGSLWIHPNILSELIVGVRSSDEIQEKKLEPLSEREKEVALLIAKAYTYNQMAQELQVSARTIKAHAQSIYTKLNVKDRLALALYLKS